MKYGTHNPNSGSNSDTGSLSKARRKSPSMVMRSGKFSKLSARKSSGMHVKQSGRIKSPTSSNP